LNQNGGEKSRSATRKSRRKRRRRKRRSFRDHGMRYWTNMAVEREQKAKAKKDNNSFYLLKII